ncbi:MAG: PAS domain S-box protein [Stagnimonas sp.]|nr:PAS domain S-box protein [Stagnimonas sp.]
MSGPAPSSAGAPVSATASGASDDPRWVGLVQRLSMASGLIVMLIGLAALASWALDIPAWRSLLPRWGAMAPNTALAFALAGAALLALHWRRYAWAPRLAQLLALLLLVIALATLLQYLTGQDYGIDQRLFQDPAHSVRTLHAARMAPLTVFNFVLAAAALLLLATNSRVLRSLARVLALWVFVGAYLGGITFLQSGSALFGLAAYAGIATYTLIAFALLAAGLLCVAPTQGWTAPLVSASAGGRMIRRMLPYALIGPAVLAWLDHVGQAAGLYDHEFGGALFALVMMLLFCGLIWWSGVVENRAEGERRYLLAERLGLEERFRYLFRDLPLGLALRSADGRVQVNPALCRILGYPEPELIARDWWTLAHPEDVPGNQALLDQLRSGATDSIRFTSRYRHQTGAVVWAEVHMALHPETDGRSSYVLATITDISEQKAADAKLQQSELRYRGLFESSRDGIVQLDSQGRFTEFNQAYQNLLGYTRAELLGRHYAEITAPQWLVMNAEMLAKQVPQRGYSDEYEKEYIHKDGSLVPVSVRAFAVRSESGAMLGTWANIRDIRERRQAERALKASEVWFRSLIEGTSDIVAVIGGDLRVRYISPAVRALGGYEPAELVGSELTALVHPGDLANIKRGMAELLEHPERTTKTEARYQNKAGAWRNTEAMSRNLLAVPAVAGIVVSLRDITERKQAEVALRESDRRFSGLLETVQLAAVMLDVESRITYCNDYFLKLVGEAREAVLGQNWFEHFVPPAAAGELAEVFRSLLADQAGALHHQNEVLTHGGERRLIRWSNSVLHSAGGEVIGTASIGEDIGARQAMEASLQLANLLIEQSPTVLFRWAAKPGWPVDYVSQNVRQWGYEPDELLSGKTAFADLIHPDDLSRVAEEVAAHLASGAKQFAQMYRIRSKAGAVIWVDDRTTVERDAQDQPVFFQGVVLDITERKLEEELRKARLLRVQAQLQALGEIINSTALAAGDVEALAGEITERVARVARVERASVWLFDATGSELRCIDLYEATPARHSAGLVMKEHEYRNEFRALREASFVDADQPLTDVRTSGYVESYIKPLGITSMLDVVVQVATRNVGLLCLEHVGPEHHWETDEIAFASQLADQIGFALTTARQLETEHRLRRVNRTLQSLSACDSAVVHAVSEEQLLQRMCEVAVDPGGYQMAWVGYAEQDAACSIRPVARAGDGADYLRNAKLSWADGEAGRGPAGLSIRTGEVQVIHDIANAPSMRCWQEAASAHGYRSIVALPLQGATGPFGTLVIYSGEVGAFGPEELALLTEMAGDLAYGITALRTHVSNEQGLQRLERSMEATVQALANTVEMRDPYTAGHQKRVAGLAVAMARVMGLSAVRIQGLELAASIHDIGKVRVPAEILNKPGALSKIEFQLIQVHAQTGYEILKDVSFPWPIADMVRQHHERLDGSGYPQGLKAEQILQESKILAVADVVEAMSSHRPYRPARGIEPALELILQERGKTLDAESVDACVALFREQGYQMPLWKTD